MQAFQENHERAGFAGLREGCAQFRSFVTGLLVLLVGLVWFAYAFRDDISQRMAAETIARINQDLEGTGWSLTLGSARVTSTSQLSLSDLQVFAPGNPQPVVLVNSLAVHLSAPWQKGQQGLPRPEALVLDQSQIQVDLRHVEPEAWKRLADYWSQCPADKARPVLEIRNAICQILAESQNMPLELRQIQLQTREIDQGKYTFWQCEGDFFKRWALRLRHACDGQPWSCESQLSGINLNDSLLQFLQEAQGAPFDELRHLTGEIDLHLQAQPDQAGEWQVSLSGSAQQIHLLHQRIAIPITEGSLDFVVQDNQFRVNNIRAKVGDGECRASYWQAGLWERGDFEFRGQMDNLNLTPQVGELLNEQGRKFFSDFSPAGLVSFEFAVGQRGNAPFRSVQARVHDLAVTYHKFPYTLEHFVGNFNLQDQRCELDLQSLVGAEILSLKGFVINPGPQAIIDVRFECPGNLPIDDKLFRALRSYPNVYKQVAALRPRGQLSVTGRIEKPDPQQPLILSYDVDLKQCLVRHEAFDYPLRNVTGQVSVRGQQVAFRRLVGENLTANVSCEGDWNTVDGLRLRFWAQQLQLDEQLRTALPPTFRDIWNEIRPSGRLPLARVDLSLPRNSPGPPQLDILLDARQRSAEGDSYPLAIRPLAFPYVIENLEGLVTLQGNRIRVQDLHGRHARGWVKCTGDGTFDDQGWQLTLNDLLAGGIAVNDDLCSALPASLQCALDEIDFQGNCNLSGTLTLAGRVVPSDLALLTPVAPATEVVPASFTAPEQNRKKMQTSLSWNLRLDVDGGSLFVGVDLEDVHGQVRLAGSYDGTRAFSEGEIDLESLTICNARVTHVQGPIWIDDQHVGVGFFATPFGSQPNSRSLSGELFGGQVEFDGHTWRDGQQKFYLQTTMTDIDLREAAANLAPTMQSVEGRAQFWLRLAGQGSSRESLLGEGQINMYHARLYELPVLLATLKQLRNFNEDKSAFDSGNIDFGIRGKQVTLSRIELNGDPISLVGNGEIDLDQNVDLNFYTLAGRNRIYVPLVSELYQAGSQQILWISVDGTLRAPRTKQEILPGLNDSLKELFKTQ